MDQHSIDFTALERELNAAIEADARYKRENDAKFRAVNQKVASYDEFRDIVKAAHLKPLDKGEKLQDNTKRNSIWNTIAPKKKEQAQYPKLPAIQALQLEDVPLPCNIGDFLKHWRILDCNGRLNLLRRMDTHHINLLFNVEIPVGVLGDIFQVLLPFQFNNSDIIFVIRMLEELPKAKRFDLCLQFLSSVEKEVCRELLIKLNHSFQNRQQDLAEEGITEWTILELRKKYKM